jgi:hypothetical protein
MITTTQHHRRMLNMQTFLSYHKFSCFLLFLLQLFLRLMYENVEHYKFLLTIYLNYICHLSSFINRGSFATGSTWHRYRYIPDEYITNCLAGPSIPDCIYSCIGRGVMSFWIGFVTANRGSH